MSELRLEDGERSGALRLRALETTDALFLMELNNDPETARFVLGNPRRVTLQEQLQWMEMAKTQTSVKRFIVEHDAAPAGVVVISEIDTANLTASIGIKLHKSMRGKGIGKRSIRLALKYCFEICGFQCATARVLTYNAASLALFASCGFVNEGVLRSRTIKNGERCDLVSFSILRDEYERRSATAY